VAENEEEENVKVSQKSHGYITENNGNNV